MSIKLVLFSITIVLSLAVQCCIYIFFPIYCNFILHLYEIETEDSNAIAGPCFRLRLKLLWQQLMAILM